MNLCLPKLTGKFRPYNGVKTQIILQLSATECGVTALAMVLGYHGVHVSLEMLRERCGTSRDGAKASTLIAAAESLGFEAAAYRVELADIAELNRPVVAYWRFNHYVVINGVGDERVFIHDPASGAITVSFTEFDKSFTGIVIDMVPTAATVTIKVASHWRPMLRAWLSGRELALAFMLASMAVVISAPMLNARMTAAFIDYCVIGRNMNWLLAFSVISVVSGLAMLVSLRLQKITQFRITMKASVIQSAEMLKHLLKLPLIYFSLRQKPEIAAMIVRAEVIATTLFQSLAAASISVLTSLAALFFLVKIDSVLTIILLSLLGLLFIPARLLTRLNMSYEQANVTTLSKYYSYTLSNLKNIETIKTVGMESTILQKWIAALHEKTTIQDKSNCILLILVACSQSFNSLSMLVTLFAGSMRVASGVLSVGELMAFYGLQLFFASQVMAILHAVKDWQNTYATQIRMNDMLNHSIDSRFMLGSADFSTESSTILECQDLSFYYNPTEAPVISNINLSIKPGQHIAFVGGTGSGKSTLVKLLAHLYVPASGRLLLHGRECVQGGASNLARVFAYVSQELCLFSGTIYDNLTMWKPNVPLAVVEAAIHDACLTDLIQQRGLYGRVDEGGINFSGGERQRLDIARALIQSPSILALDEATSALDSVTEATLLAHLRKRRMTILFVAHRLATVKHCDQIMVIDRGQIIEQGSHAALVENAAHYCHLWQSDQVQLCH